MIELKSIGMRSHNFNVCGLFQLIRNLISKFRWQLVVLTSLLTLQVLIAIASVITVIPLSEFLLSTDLNEPHWVSVILNDWLEAVGFGPSFYVFASIFLLSNLLKGLSDLFVEFHVAKLKYVIHRRLTTEVVANLLQADWGYLSSLPGGKILNTLRDEMARVCESISYVAQQVANILQLCVFITIPFLVNSEATTIASSLALIFAVPFLWLHKKSFLFGKMNTDTANDYVNEISETFSFRRANKILAANQYVLSRIHNFHALHVSAALKSHLLRISISHLYYPCALAATVVAVGAVYDKVSISNLSVFLWSFVRAAPVLTKILQSNVTMLNFFPSYVQVQTISENARLKREVSGNRVFTQLDTPITLQNISFGFKGEKPILTDINMEIVPGKITALIGLSGSGKSTIIDLLLRLKNPLSGKILVNGVSLGEYDVESWRCAIGYVSQEPKVRNMTIRENLTFGLRRSVSDGIDHSLQKSNSLDIIASKEKGLETAVGGLNGDLSGGEKQRLNLAKAVLSSPSLLILDEATNQQDLESTSKIKASLTNLKSDMAIFLVAHQSDVLDVADIIYRLDNGKIIKQKS